MLLRECESGRMPIPMVRSPGWRVGVQEGARHVHKKEEAQNGSTQWSNPLICGGDSFDLEFRFSTFIGKHALLERHYN